MKKNIKESKSESIKKDLFGKKILTELLLSVICYLPREYILVCEKVCIDWSNHLNSILSKKILSPLKFIKHSRYLKTKYHPKTLARIGNYIYSCNTYISCKLDMKNFAITDSNINAELLSTNENFICVKSENDIIIYSSNMKLIEKISIENCQGLAIDNNDRIYVSTNDKLHAYNLEKKLINSWDLPDNKNYLLKCRNIAVTKNEIFVVDTCFNCVRVFSYEDKETIYRSSFINESNDFCNPEGIAIYHDIIFIVDSGNKKIKSFRRDGRFILSYDYKRNLNNANIIVTNNHIYINNFGDREIMELKLLFF
jgi:hypothetical protein